MNIKEWIIKTGVYSGRGLVRSMSSESVILWFYLRWPKDVGLIYTFSDGSTFLDGKKLGNIAVRGEFTKMTHRVVLEHFGDRLGVSDYDVWDYLEHQRNARGRIVQGTIYVYDEDTSTSVNIALQAIKNYIKDDWYLKEEWRIERNYTRIWRKRANKNDQDILLYLFIKPDILFIMYPDGKVTYNRRTLGTIVGKPPITHSEIMAFLERKGIIDNAKYNFERLDGRDLGSTGIIYKNIIYPYERDFENPLTQVAILEVKKQLGDNWYE